MRPVKNRRPSRLLACLIVCVLAALGCIWYVSDYYHADLAAIEAFMPTVQGAVLRENATAYGSGTEAVGLIFYPGGKVEPAAYEPLMKQLAGQGVLGVLVKMPCNLAVLDLNAAEGIAEKYPEVARWYIGGHSLGGSMAAYYAASHEDELQGLVLLGAYSSADLSDTDLKVLSVYGSEDQVMNRSKYEKYRPMLPGDLTEIVLEGGCHAGFGLYGPQKGDGAPAITAQEQIQQTAQAICAFVMQEGSDAQNH